MPIRDCRIEDAEAVAGLLRELCEAAGEEGPAGPEGVREQLREMGRLPELYRNLVYEEEGRVLGYLSILLYRSALHRRGTAQVNELVVATPRRGAGIGGALIERAIAEARALGMDEIEVGVERGNEGARRFYRRHGISEEYLLLGLEFE